MQYIVREELTDINVPGRKNSVTRVMIFIDIVSCLVFCATVCISFVMFCMSLVMASMLSADCWDFSASSSFAFVFRCCKMP